MRTCPESQTKSVMVHYEFQKNGNHVDPLKVELPAAQPLKAELLGSLSDLSEDLLAQMRSVVPNASASVVTVAARQISSK